MSDYTVLHEFLNHMKDSADTFGVKVLAIIVLKDREALIESYMPYPSNSNIENLEVNGVRVLSDLRLDPPQNLSTDCKICRTKNELLSRTSTQNTNTRNTKKRSNGNRNIKSIRRKHKT